MSLGNEGCTMSRPSGEKALVCLGNSAEDSPLGSRTDNRR